MALFLRKKPPECVISVYSNFPKMHQCSIHRQSKFEQVTSSQVADSWSQLKKLSAVDRRATR